MFDEFYALTGRPFQLTPDPAFYFPSGTHRKALSYLGYGLAQGEGFIVITGEVGAGKSTLVAHLVSTIDPNQLTVGQIVTSKLNEDEIIHVVAHSFGLDIGGHDKAAALSAIEGFLHEEARAGRRCLLVVDESQNLSVDALEELRMLSNFQLGSHPLLQILLLGQPEFRETLQGHSGLEQLRQRVIATHHLAAMEQKEVEPYILHRLCQVGWDDNPTFDPSIFSVIYTASGGVPRRINQIVNRLLLLGAVEQTSNITGAMLAAVLSEMERDNAAPETPDVPSSGGGLPELDLGAEEVPVSLQPATGGFDPALLESALAERDAQITELQQAVVELATAQEENTLAATSPDIAVLNDRVAQLEAQLIEQERMMRHTITMLIEWVEDGDNSQIIAA